MLTVSVDSVYSHKVWADREGFDFPLLADFWPHGAVAQAYGVFNEAAGFANRGTFVIDKAGVVRFAEMTGPGEARDQKAWRRRWPTDGAPAPAPERSPAGRHGRMTTPAAGRAGRVAQWESTRLTSEGSQVRNLPRPPS